MAENSNLLNEIWRDVQEEGLGGSTYEVAKEGDQNFVLLVKDAPKPYVVKAPRVSAGARRFCLAEIDVCTLLSIIPEEPPVRIPESIAFNEAPLYGIFEYIEGETVASHRTARKLSKAEQRQVGTKIGQFVAWMGREFTKQRYDELLCSTPPSPFNASLKETLGSYHLMRKLGFRGLQEALVEIHGLGSIYKEEIAAPPIVGHDDLHSGNILAERDADKLEVTGVIDFGHVRPTHPERELRNMLSIGPEAIQSATEAYQEESGREISQDLLRYWTLSRWTMMCVLNIRKRQQIPMPIAEEYMNFLKPDVDWSELSRWNDRLTDYP